MFESRRWHTSVVIGIDGRACQYTLHAGVEVKMARQAVPVIGVVRPVRYERRSDGGPVTGVG